MNNDGGLFAISIVCCVAPMFFIFVGWVARGIALKGYRLRSPLGKPEAYGTNRQGRTSVSIVPGAAVPPARRQTEAPVVQPPVTK